MEHRAATEEVIRLIPSMAKSTPEQVLIKRAMDGKWAPAQLLKVAQVYNTCSTLHAQTIDRNAMPQLVDPPSLVTDYVNQSGRSALKVASSFLTGEESVLDKVASALDEPQPTEVPRIWSEEPYKSAAQEREVDPKIARRWAIEDFTKSAHQVMRRVDSILDQRFAYSNVLEKSAAELRTSLRAGDSVFIDLERDGRACREPGMVKQALDQIEAIAKQAGAAVERFDPTRHRDSILGRDTTGKLNLLDAVNESFVKYACEFTALEEELTTLLKCASAAPLDADARLGSLMDKVKGSLLHIEDLTKSAAAPELNPEPQEPLTPTKVVYLQNPEAPSQGGKSEGATAPKPTDLAPSKDAVKGITEKAVSILDPAARTLQWASSDLGNIVEGEGKKYQARQASLQRELDSDSVDIKSLHNLRRLMILDEVISEVDPDMAVEAYNSIRRAHPEVANDIGTLRLLLRQAVQHQGLDIDSASLVRKFGDDNKISPQAPSAQ